MTRYRCNRCKYVYDPARGDPQAGVSAGTPFSALPAGWQCPVSGAPKAEFFELAEQRAEQSSEKSAERAAPKAPLPPPPPVAPRPPLPNNVWTVGPLKKQRLG